MDPDLQLDPLNPPKYCPQCARSGLKSKVKKFKMDPSSLEVVIMCKNDQCPWPFSVQSQAGATVQTNCGEAESPSATSTPARPASRKRKIKQKIATQDSNHEAEPPDITTSSGYKKMKLDSSSEDKSNAEKCLPEKPQESKPPTEGLKLPTSPTGSIAAVTNGREEVDGVRVLAHYGVALECDQKHPSRISTTNDIIQEDALINEDSNKPDADSSVKTPIIQPQSYIPINQVIAGIQASCPDNQADCRDDSPRHKQTSALSTLSVSLKVVESPAGVETPHNETPAEDQIPDEQIELETPLSLKPASAVVLTPPEQASAEQTPLAILGVDLLPHSDTSEDQILSMQDTPDVKCPEQLPPGDQITPEQADSDILKTPSQSSVEHPHVQNCQQLAPLCVQNSSVEAPSDTQSSPDVQNTQEQALKDVKNEPALVSPDVQKTPLQSSEDVQKPAKVQSNPYVQKIPIDASLDTHNTLEEALDVQNTSVQGTPDVLDIPKQAPSNDQHTPLQVPPNAQSTPVKKPRYLQNYPGHAPPDIKNTLEQAPPHVQNAPGQDPPDVQNSPIQIFPDNQETTVVQSDLDVQKTAIEASQEFHNIPEEALEVQNTPNNAHDVKNTTDVKNIPKLAPPDDQHTPIQVTLDVQTPLTGSAPGLNIDSSSVCRSRKAVNLALEPAQLVHCEHAVLAASSLKLLLVNKIENEKVGQTAKRNEVITRSGRKVKPKILHFQNKHRSGEEASVTKNTTSSKNVIENVPDVKPVSKISKSVGKEVSRKIEGIEQMDNNDDVLDEDDKNLEEEKRIQSLIKPPYPRRRQRGRKADKEVVLKPSLKSPSTKRNKTPSKLDDKVVNPCKPDNLNRSGSSEQTEATPNQNLPRPQLAHTHVSDNTDTEAESIESLNDDLIEKVTKALEKQNEEAIKTSKIEAVINCEDLQRNLSMDEVSYDKIERIIEVEDIQVLKPKRTYQRAKKANKFTFHPSNVSGVSEVEKINLDIGVRQKESVILAPLSFKMNNEDREMEDVLRLGTVVGVKHVTEHISEEEEEDECSLSEAVLSESECEFETSRKEISENNKEISLIDIQCKRENFFLWRKWNIDFNSIRKFSDYLRKLINKWKPPKNISIDPRIHVLLKEKEKNTENPEHVLKMISFFSEVFVKYIYIKTNLPNLDSFKVLGLLKQCLVLEKKQFMKEIQIIKDEEKTQSTVILQTSVPIIQPVKVCTISVNINNTSSCPPSAHAHLPRSQPLLTSQPLNLSIKVPVLQIPTKLGEEEDTSTKTSSDSEKKTKPLNTQILDLVDKQNSRKRKGADEVEVDGHFEEYTGLEFNNKSKKEKKIKSIEKSKLYEKKFATSEDSTSSGTNLLEKKGNLDVLNVVGGKGELVTGKKSRNIGVEIGNGKKLVDNAIKEERQKSENPTMKTKCSPHRDGGFLDKLLKTAQKQPVGTKCSPMGVKVDDRVNLVNKSGGSRRKNSTPTQVMNVVKPKKPQSPVTGVSSIPPGNMLGESMLKRQGISSGPTLYVKTAGPSNIASSSKIVQKSSSVEVLVTAADGEGLGSFEQAFARKKQTEKIKKVLEIQKRKAEAGTSKKYKGFGEAVDPVKVVVKKKKKEKKAKEMVKKAQVSKSEKDLMEELLSIGDTAVAVAKSSPVMDKSTVDVASRQPPVDTSAVFEFEELQTLGGSMADQGDIVEDFESLFEFN